MTDRFIEDLEYWSLHESIPSYVQDLLRQAAQRLKDVALEEAADDPRVLEALWSIGSDN